MVAISVDLTIHGWTIARILRDRVWSRSRYATTRVGELRTAYYELLATSTAPHYSVILHGVSELAAAEFLSHFGPTLENQFRQRSR